MTLKRLTYSLDTGYLEYKGERDTFKHLKVNVQFIIPYINMCLYVYIKRIYN